MPLVRMSRVRAVIVGLLALLVAILAGRLYVAQRELRAGAAGLSALASAAATSVAQPSSAPTADAVAQLGEACSHLNRGAAWAEPIPLLLRPLRVVPALRGWGQLEDVLRLSRALCAVQADGQALLRQMASPPGAGGDFGPRLLAALDTAKPSLQQLAADSSAALEYESRLQASDFRGPLQPIGSRLPQLARLDPLLSSAKELAPVAPQLVARLLGVDRSRTYLIVGQNNAEPRATGGFVGVMGPLELSAGRVVRTDFRSSYDWDNPSLPPRQPPQALLRYMNFGAWFIRDANFWPDFPRSAAEFETFWRYEQGAPIDGVIAVDLVALDDLLNAVGGIEVPELGGLVTGGSVEQRIDQLRRNEDVLASAVNYQRAKTELLGAVYRALLPKLLQPAPERLPAIGAALLHDLQTKHILLSFDDATLAKAVVDQGWAGHLSPQPGESLAIVDTSVSYGKVGPYIHKSAEYSRSADGEVNLRLTYTNSFVPTPGAPWDRYIDGLRWDWQARRFVEEQGAWVGYIRVIVPAGSRLVSSQGWDDPPASTNDVDGFSTFAAPVVVRPGATRSVELVYKLPAGTSSDALRLTAQPGASPYQLAIRTASGRSIEQTIDGRDVLVVS